MQEAKTTGEMEKGQRQHQAGASQSKAHASSVYRDWLKPQRGQTPALSPATKQTALGHHEVTTCYNLPLSAPVLQSRGQMTSCGWQLEYRGVSLKDATSFW